MVACHLVFCTDSSDYFLLRWKKTNSNVFLVYGQDQSHGQAHGGDDQPLRDGSSSSSAADVRQRRQGAHGEIWYVCVTDRNYIEAILPHTHTLDQCFNLFQAQNPNTLPKLPGRTTSILQTIRKTLTTDGSLGMSSNWSSSCVNMCPSLCRYSQFQDEYSLEQVKGSRKVFDYLTLLQCW